MTGPGTSGGLDRREAPDVEGRSYGDRMNRAVWITWERQRRNRELANALGIALFEWADLDRDKIRPRKYAVGISRTAALLFRQRPLIVVGQNPSLVLALTLLLLRPVVGYRLIVDAHNAGLRPADGRSRLLNRISRLIQRRADLTLVSNEALKRVVESHGGSAFVLPDRIPELLAERALPLSGRANVVFVCSFASDEPWEQVLDAARLLDTDVLVHVTGDYRKTALTPSRVPGNVVLTGYLSEDEYVRVLASADLVMDLTTREDCLVCGAYEAVSLLKPMVLSDTEANRRYFDRGCVYSSHDPASLARAITTGLARKDQLGREVAALKASRQREWEVLRRELLERMNALIWR